ncbi:FUSC family protein [Mycobacterium celatum]|uniref:FUSC family protein n=1 Tax=Mycobacterium celatum TaxID=28045 RepID=UPI000A478E90|nr:FUSC family protein [Mycobacterium celatum]
MTLVTRALWPIAQTAIAASLAWYLARDVLGHHNPFFAPIAAAVCLWATNVVRAELAVEMVIGVTLGIGIGAAVHAVLGSGPLAMGAAVLISLCIADLIGRGFTRQRPMFVNQTTMSAILILAFPYGGVGPERLFDALIGGGLAVAFSILIFPKNPLAVLRGARDGTLTALRDILVQIADVTDDLAPDWALKAADRLHRQLARLIEARSTAIQLARVCPLRWPLREATRAADRQAAQLALLANSVLQLARTVTNHHRIAEPLRAAIRDLADAGTALAEDQLAVAVVHASSAHNHTVELCPTTHTTEQVRLAAVIDACADELQQVVEH